MNNGMITVRSELLNEQYTRFKHKSGLTVYVYPKERNTSCAVIATKFGSMDNDFKVDGDPDFTKVPDGVAHFLEHKMFENEDGEDTFVKFSRTGASANAGTSFFNTEYYFSCTDNLYESLEILLRMVYSPYFTDSNVQKEQGIIAQEIRMYDDDPWWAAMSGMLRCLYKENSIRLDIAGTVESISEITPEILYRCYNAFYNPQNMALCVCGQAEENKVKEIVDKVLDDFKPVNVESRYVSENQGVYKERETCKMQVAKPIFYLGVKDTAVPSDSAERLKRTAATEILNSFLFSKSSDFYNDMYNDGLISDSLGSGLLQGNDHSIFIMWGDSDDPEKLYSRFKDYIEKFTSEPFDTALFENNRRAVYSGILKGFDSTENIADLVVSSAVKDCEIFEFMQQLHDVTPEYAADVAKSMFRIDSCAISIVYPLSKP